MNKISEEKIEKVIRGCCEATTKRDLERMLSFYVEDATLVTPEGTFKGKEEIKRYLTWTVQFTPKLTVTDAGIGILVRGNKAIYEQLLEGTTEGREWRALCTCIYEFSEEKIQHQRIFYDRLSIDKQVAHPWLAKKVVNWFVKRAEKGLH